MSTSSPANNRCSSKQKHSTFEKYGAICIYATQLMLYLGEGGTYAIGGDIICRNSNDVLVGMIFCSVKG